MMKIHLILIIFIGSVSFHAKSQEINFNPKPLKKDIQKIWKVETVELDEIEVPDSLYNDILLDKGKIYHTRAGTKNSGFAYIGRIYSCRMGGCGMYEGQGISTADENFEYFDYYIIFNQSLEVEKIRVYNYQATHGHEVSGRGWLKQFIGYEGDEKLEYGKNIDSISGATISANAITYNVQESSRYLHLLKPILEIANQHLKAIVSKWTIMAIIQKPQRKWGSEQFKKYIITK